MKLIKKSYAGILSFLLPAGILFAVYIYMGVYPFGQKTLLTIDMTNEYVDYFSAFKAMFTGGGSVFYSFSKLLGGNMAGLFAYYLASPFNIIFFFFDRANFDVAILLLTLIKIGFCGLTFYLYLNRSFPQKGLLPVVFSVFYALMAYNIIYQLNIMWLDGVICLPLVMLGVDRIIEGKRAVLYYIFLMLAIVTNYYIGYMICIFALLYFIYKLLLSEHYKAAFLKFNFFRDRFICFLFTSVLSAGTSCFLMLPAVLSLQTGKEHFSLSNLAFYPNYKFLGILSKIVLGSHTYADVKSGLPDIFCGLLVTLLLGLYFFNRLISRREKLFSGLFILVMLLNFYLNTFNKIWHGFNPPAWFPFRYSFVFSFLVIVMAYRCIIHFKGIRIRHIMLVCVMILAILIMLASVGYGDLTAKKIAISSVFTAVYSVILVFTVRSKHVPGRALALMLIPYVICEFGYSTYGMLSDYSYASRNYYSSFVQSVGAVVTGIQSHDKSFYRMEKTFTRLNYNSKGNPTVNDPMMFQFNGLSHYSSTDDKQTNYLMQCLGFKNNYNWAYYYRGSTVAANSLLGVKYIVTESAADSSYRLLSNMNGYDVNENPYALPIAFLSSSNIRKVRISAQNPFDTQNKILDAMVSKKQNMCFTAIKLNRMTLENVRAVKNGSMTRYIRIDQSKPASLVFSYSSDEGGSDYAFFNTTKFHKVQLLLNGEDYGRYFDTYHYGVLPLGNSVIGRETTLEMKLTDTEVDLSNAEFYHMDLSSLSGAYDDLSQNGLSVTAYSSTYISGTVTTTPEKHVLFTSIPYDTGWRVTIDGRPAPTHKVLDSLISVYVPKGSHKIEFYYRPPGFAAGCVIAVISALTAAAYFYALHRRWENLFPQSKHAKKSAAIYMTSHRR